VGECKCKFCGSENVVGISRVVGYFSTINNWNPGKKAEFEDRQKGSYKISGESK
jgi:anaerobic ribonucleoside-triphosphate reductase